MNELHVVWILMTEKITSSCRRNLCVSAYHDVMVLLFLLVCFIIISYVFGCGPVHECVCDVCCSDYTAVRCVSEFENLVHLFDGFRSVWESSRICISVHVKMKKTIETCVW